MPGASARSRSPRFAFSCCPCIVASMKSNAEFDAGACHASAAFPRVVAPDARASKDLQKETTGGPMTRLSKPIGLAAVACFLAAVAQDAMAQSTTQQAAPLWAQ